jgi:hypothetical protein
VSNQAYSNQDIEDIISRDRSSNKTNSDIVNEDEPELHKVNSDINTSDNIFDVLQQSEEDNNQSEDVSFNHLIYRILGNLMKF